MGPILVTLLLLSKSLNCLGADSKVEAFAKTSIKARLYSANATIQKTKVLKDLKLDDPKITDLTSRRFLMLQIAADENAGGGRYRSTTCVAVASDPEIKNYRILAVQKCDENLSKTDLEAIEKITSDYKKLVEESFSQK